MVDVGAAVLAELDLERDTGPTGRSRQTSLRTRFSVAGKAPVPGSW